MSDRIDFQPRSAAGTLLVADPDPVLRESICTVMGRAGYKILAQAESLDDTRRLLRKLQPGLIILGQPKVESDLLDRVRALRAGTLSPLLLLSPIPNLEWIRAVRSSGVDLLLGRPPREADLVAAVEMAIARKQEAVELQREITALRERLETAHLIQKAKEQLMRRDRITESEAYDRLRRQAELSGRPLRNIAEAVVLAASITPAA